MGVTDFVSEIKRVENYPDFEKIVAHHSAWSTGVYSLKYRRSVNGAKRS